MSLAPISMVPVLGCIVSVFTLTGCPAPSERPCDDGPALATPAQVQQARESPQTLVPGRPAPTVPPAPPDGFRTLETLKDVRFGSGRSDVLWVDSASLETVVVWLKQKPTWLVLIEGYSDDLGTKEQNLAMGERRAKSVMKYLVSKGVEANRIAIKSYGSDRPVCTEKTDACRAKNRRVHFLVKER